MKENKHQIENIINEMNLQSDVRKYLSSQLEKLEDWDFTRDNTFGIEFPLDKKLTLYLWFESLIGYYSLILRFGLDKSKINFVHFLGKNIVYYHGVIWPIILKNAINDKAKISLSVRGFWNELKSDQEMLNISEFSEKYDTDFLRFYIAYKVNDKMDDFKMTKMDFIDVINRVLIKKIVNLNYRIYGILRKIKKIPKVESVENYFVEDVLLIKNKIKNNEVNGALKAIIDVVDKYNKKLSLLAERDVANEQKAIELAELSAFITISLKPIMPYWVEKIDIFENNTYNSFDDILKVSGKSVKNNLEKIKFVE